MLGYLFYDSKDVKRNKSFIDAIINEFKKYNIDIILYTQEDDYKNLKQPNFIINRSRFDDISKHFKLSFNEAYTTKITNDKLLTYNYFKDIIPTIKTYTKDEITSFPLVCKNRYSHGGKDVFIVENESEIKASDDYIYQDILVKGKDLRVYILDNKILAAVLRENKNDFRANYSLGGSISLYTLNNSEKEIIYKILDHIDMTYGGIDFLFDESGNIVLNELEDPVGARMLYKLTDIDVVEEYVRIIAKKLLTFK